jgi:hypothetical protein
VPARGGCDKEEGFVSLRSSSHDPTTFSGGEGMGPKVWAQVCLLSADPRGDSCIPTAAWGMNPRVEPAGSLTSCAGW